MAAGATTFGLVLVGVVATVVVRWRWSRGAERQQMKWFLATAGLLVGFGLLDLVLPAP